MLTLKKKGYRLSPETVDLLSQEFADSLTEAEADRKDILRLRLSLEEILESWSSALPGAPVTFCAKKRLGRQRIEIRVEGKELQADDVLKNCLLSSRLLAQAGLTLTQSYQNGENCLTVEPPRKRKLGQLQKLLLAIVSAVVLGLLQRLLPASAQAGVRAVTDPLFTLILNLLRTISSPMIFLLRSGSSTPASFSRKRLSASTRTKLISHLEKAASTSSPSFRRISPWSTKTQVSCFPTASASRAATTEESTPPDRASKTFPCPTFSRTAEIAVFL